MNTKALAAVAVLMAAAIIFVVPASVTDASPSTNVDGESVIGTGSSEEYTITYTNNDYAEYLDSSLSIRYTAKLVKSNGETVTNGVSPSSGSLDNGISKILTVRAPSSPDTCKLIVEYKVEVTYTPDSPDEDESDEGVEQVTEELESKDEFRIKVVTPITLSVTLKNNTNLDLTGYGVYFEIDGKKMDDSYTTVNLTGDGTATVSYQWITDSGSGTYSFKVIPASEGNLVDIEGLDEVHTFYIGDKSFTMWIVLLVVIIILLALIMLWVYRKPVKNYGKPKSRR